jgi:hypothetical protein
MGREDDGSRLLRRSSSTLFSVAMQAPWSIRSRYCKRLAVPQVAFTIP